MTDAPAAEPQAANDPATTGLLDAVRPSFDRLDAIPATLVAIHHATGERVAKYVADNRSSLNPEALEAGRQAIVDAAMKRIAELEQMATAASADIETAIATATQKPPVATQEAILEEMRQTRAWERVKAHLAAANGDAAVIHATVIQLARDAVAAKDGPTIDALRAEMPTYVRTLTRAAENGTAKLVGPMLDAIDELDATWRSPAYGVARKARRELDHGSAALKGAFYHVRDVIEEGRPLYTVPGFRPGTQLGTGSRPISHFGAGEPLDPAVLQPVRGR